MGLRCLIGHEYGDAQTERDRRQRGSEVVVTVREFRECTRCGHRRIISENKEVTTDAGAGPPDEPADDPPVEASWSPPDEGGITDEPVGAAPVGGTDPGGPEEPMTAEEDDGVILEDEPDEPRRAHGEWPDADLGGTDAGPDDDPGPWPDEAAEAPESAEPETRSPASTAPEPDAAPDGEPSGADPGPADQGSAAAADPDGSAEVLDEADTEPTGESSRPADEPSSRAPERPTPRPDPTEVELVCPDCGETWPSINVSLRPGDICPDCRAGYLDEQVIQ